MKIQLTFKSPDAIHYALKDCPELNPDPNINYTRKEELWDIEDKREEVKEIIGKFIEYGEYCTIEIDTETKEARVVPVNE